MILSRDSISTRKQQDYKDLIAKINALIEPETNLIANLSNIIALLKNTFNWLWVGIYFKDQDDLVLGPFQGPVACTRIPIGKGVCGQCALLNESIIVPNVEDFKGHIACSSLSKSEIVVPITDTNGQFIALIDIDSDELDHFDTIDQTNLEYISRIIKEKHYA